MKVLVIGAGAAGKEVLRKLQEERQSDILVVGFVDDNEHLFDKVLNGVKVIGIIDNLPSIIEDYDIDQVLISIPSVGKSVIERVANLVPAGFPIKILPSISSVMLGSVDLSYVRDIDPSDLIGRPLVKTDQEYISKNAEGKTFLVTGGAGSIGSEIVRQLCSTKAKEVIVVDSWEEGVFNLLEELSRMDESTRKKCRAFIGNVRDRERMKEILETVPVDTIIHAAAYKHVPLMEENPGEAQKTNREGTRNMLDLAVTHNIKEFVLISSDKAVRPSSVMGESKRAAELLVQEYARAHPDSRFAAVRFGNVLGSSGSIVPKFLRQIRERSSVTVTDFAMTRYFMSIPEAVSLVLMAWIIAENGQILLLDMGEPVRILDLAESLIRIHGLEPYTDISIIETGIRPGEKIHEELLYDKQSLKPTKTDRISIAEQL